jgi:hypothetical protein
MSLSMHDGKTVTVKSIDEDDCTEHNQIINLVEMSKMKAVSIPCNIVIEICSTVKY